MKVSSSKCTVMVFNREKMESSLHLSPLFYLRQEFLPKVEKFKYQGILFTSDDRLD